MISPARTLVGVRVGDRTLDVAIPFGLPVYEVLRAAGVDLDDPALTVVDSGGRQVDLYSTTGDQLEDGSVLHVLTRQRGPRVAPGGHESHDPAASRPTRSSWWLGVAGAAAVVVTATVVLSIGGGQVGLAARDRWPVGGLLLLAGFALAVLRRPGTAGSVWPTAVAALAGAAGGAVTVDPALAAAGQLLVVTALVGATAVTAARWAAARRTGDPAADPAGILLVLLAGAAVTCAGVLLAGLPSVLAAAVLLGAAPLVVRALPTLAVDVPDDQLIDVAQVARTAVSVRAPAPKPLGAVNPRMVQRTVLSAERRRDAGTVLAALLAPLSAPAVLASAEPGGLTGWAALAACLMVILALALQPRTTRGALVRWAPRAGAAVLLLELGVLGAGSGGPMAAGFTAVSIVLGLLVAVVSLAVGRGWRSVGFSRFADAIEGLCTVLALPTALVAAGVIEVLRLVTSS